MNDEDSKPRISLAQDLAKKLLKEAEITSSPVVLNQVFRHLKGKYNLKIIPFKLGKKTSGIQATKGKEIVIGYNASQHPNRQRFTIAHEIGHLLLGHTHQGSDYESDSKEFKEIEANHFASELLMPENILKDDYLFKGIDPKILASNYQVSEQAMWLRLLDCKLIKY